MAEHVVPLAPARRSQPVSVPNLIVSLAFGVLGIATVVWVTGGEIDLGAIAAIAPSFLLLAVGLIFADWALEGVRLLMLCRALGEPIRISTVLRIVTSAMFVARVTPFNSGGDPFQIYSLCQVGMPLGRATAAVAVKSLLHGSARVGLGLTVPVLIAFTAVDWQPGAKAKVALYMGLGLYLAAIALAVSLFIGRAKAVAFTGRMMEKPRLAKWLARPRIASAVTRLADQSKVFVDAVGRFGHGQRRTLALAGLLSLLGWSSIIIVPLVLVRAFDGQAPATAIAATSVIFYLAVAFGPTPGSAGASEMAFAALFGTFVPSAVLGALVLVWRLLTHYTGLVIGFLVMMISLGHLRQGTGPVEPGISALGGQNAFALAPPEYEREEDVRD